jgi:hypothetical protein
MLFSEHLTTSSLHDYLRIYLREYEAAAAASYKTPPEHVGWIV